MIKRESAVKEALKNIGLLDETKIQVALKEQIRTKGRLASILVRLGYVSNQDIGKTLIPQIGILPLAVKPQDIDKKAKDSIISNIMLSHRIIPLRYESDRLVIATDDPLNFLAEENLEKIIGMSIEIELVHTLDLDRLLKLMHGTNHKQDVKLGKVSEDIKAAKGSEDAPIIKLINDIIGEAVKRRASDVHIEPLQNKFRVRYRIDGVLYEISNPPECLQGAVIDKVKMMAGMDAAEKRLPQDGRIRLYFDRKELNIRVSSLPSIHGESVVMRILDRTSYLVGLEDLGFLPDQRKDFERLINLPSGMIFVTGPIGSGKTTTLYATLSHINQKERKVITIEDPVECQLDGVNQVQVKPQLGLTFASGLRSMLRQAPDIIMVGEMQDLETAEIVIHSALTGRLIFSSLHTNDAAGAIRRLVDMGIKPHLIASTVQAVLAQRLVRTICPSCRYAYKPSNEEITKLSLKPEEVELYRGKGCPSCSETGFKGRMGIFELLTMTDELREMILYNTSSTEILQKAKKLGLRTLKEDGLEKVRRGYTTIQEILRVIQDI
jgi:type II secretory ATPase GspE/PulE/Tfp pilus assembly ATPase PilB-like protein